MDEAEHAVLLLDAEPAGAVGGVGMLVHARGDLLLEYFDDLFEDSWRDGKILVCPGYVLNDRDLNERKVLIAKPPFLCFCPC